MMTAVDRDIEPSAGPAWPPEPWLLRRAPEHLRPWFLYLGAWLGGFCYMAIVFGGLVGLIVLPLVMAAFIPETRVSRVVLWFHRLTGPDRFLPAYLAVMSLLFLFVLYGMQLAIFIRVRYGKKYFDIPRTRRDADLEDCGARRPESVSRSGARSDAISPL